MVGKKRERGRVGEGKDEGTEARARARAESRAGEKPEAFSPDLPSLDLPLPAPRPTTPFQSSRPGREVGAWRGLGCPPLGTIELHRNRNFFDETTEQALKGSAPSLEPWPSQGRGLATKTSPRVWAAPSYSGMTGPNILEEGGFLTICLGFPL